MFYITFYVKLFPWFTFWFQNGRRWPSWNSNMTCFIILFNFFTLIIFLCEIIIIQQKNDKRSIALKIITYIKEIKYGRWQPSWILKFNQNLIQKMSSKSLKYPKNICCVCFYNIGFSRSTLTIIFKMAAGGHLGFQIYLF